MAPKPWIFFIAFGKEHLFRPGVQIFLFLVCFLFTRFCSAQNNIPNDPENRPSFQDIAKVDWLNERGSQLISLNSKDSALFYANRALTEANKIYYIHGIAMAFLRKAQIEKHFDDDFALSDQFGKESLKYFEKTSDKKGIATLYSVLWYANFSQSKFDEATDYSEKAYAEALKINDQNEIFNSLTNMFSIYRQTGNYEKAFEYAEQLYDIGIKSENKFWISNSLWNLAELYTLIEDYPVALNYYRRVWDSNDPAVTKERMQNDDEFRLDMEYSELFSLTSQFDSAWHYYLLFKPANESYNSKFLVSTGEFHFLQGNFQQALKNLQLSLIGLRQRNNVNEITRAVLDIAKTYLALDDSHEALKYGREGLAIALQTKVNQNIRDGYQILSEAYGRLQQTDSSDYYFRKYSIIKDVVLDHQTKGIIAAYSYRQRISLMNKEEEIQAIKLQNETWTKNVLIGSLILLLLFAFIFSRNIILKRRSEARRRELAENELWIQKLESEKSKAELLQQRTELEMKALRAQMNPHFIFNCLNSINRFIIGNNTEKAADYLTKFAKLIRIVLEKSGKSFIPLVEELDSLKLYMDLEALRFEKPFRYEINGRRLDQERIMVPSLMIQPFVENAIWHGLGQHTQDQGKIKINLSLEKEVLHCEIIDNGIGMRGSAALKRNNEHNKQSLGIEITKNRLRLADPHLQETLGVFINELKDERGNNTGTSVLLKIPVKVI